MGNDLVLGAPVPEYRGHHGVAVRDVTAGLLRESYNHLAVEEGRGGEGRGGEGRGGEGRGGEEAKGVGEKERGKEW